MTQTIGLFEAKTHLSELVAQAEQGSEIIITRHNKPVAKIVPVHPTPPFDVEQRRRAVEALQKIGSDMRAKYGPISTQEIVQWVREGREDRSDRDLEPAPRKR